ncbi:MAG: carboxypeptidase regulatory-like domain-containing protein [Acidobacteria bacterium]|nr:carboxypeptidase regulatory-like domain-containing protein [Acidobacteriota bacterium]
MSKHAFRRGCAAVLLLLVAFVMAGAQEFRGSLTGIVTDPNGAALPGATVEIRNVEKNITNSATTNDEGSYTFPLLNPGRYTVTVTAQGFSNATRENVEIRVADKVTLDIPLSLTSVGETVTTVASTPTLETGSVSTGTTVTTQQIAELPLTDGTAYQLATLAPGISFTGNPGVGGSPTSNGNLAAFRANGGTGANNVTLDGSPNYAFDGGVGFSPPSDAVQEFKVQTNQFDAQQGYSANATVNVAIKSGGNDFHGSAWYFNRDRSRTANSFFANFAGQGRAQRTYNRFGGVVNGPVRIPGIYNGKDKTFFLASYERLKNSEGGDAQFFTVPTAKMRTGDFSELLNQTIPIRIYDPFSGCHAPSNCTVTRTAFTNNVIPAALINPAAQAVLNLYPLPNVAGAGLTNNFYSAAVRSSNYRGWLGRIDHTINQNHHVYANYYHSFNPEDRYNWAGTVNGVNPTQGVEFRTNDGGNVGYTWTVTSSTVFDLKTSLNRFQQQRQVGQTYDLAQLGFSPAFVSATRGYTTLPRFDIFTYDAQRPIRSTLGSNRSDYNEGLTRPFYTFSLQPSFTHIEGDHTARFGYDLRVLRENFASNGFQGGRFTFDGTYVTSGTTTTTGTVTTANANTNRQAYGRDVASFLLGIPVSGSNSLIDTTAASYSEQSVYHGFFFHDDFRVSPKLTLNLGLRYELEMGTTERFNRLINGFDFSTPSPIEAAARAAYTTAYNANPAAFVVTPDQFRVRGGVIYADDNRRGQWNADTRNIQPRFGAAYQLNEKTVIRGGFGAFMAPFRIEAPTQYGFSASTPFVPTNDQGRTFIANLNNPFPNGLTSAPGSGLGLLARVGQDVGASDTPIIPGNRVNAKFNRVIVGVQRELPGAFVVEANYVWSHGYNMQVIRNLNFVPRQYLGTDPASADAANTFLSATITNPFRNTLNGTAAASSPFNTATTITRAQSLLPFPQFTNVFVEEHNGSNQYNALQLQAAKRLSQDLSFNVTFTHSRLREKTSYLNPSDPDLEDRISPDDRPNRFTFASSYKLPFGKGKLIGREAGKLTNAIIGGWQLNGTYEWQSGQPFNFTQNIYYSGDANALQSHTFENGNGHKYGVFECANVTVCTNLPVFDTTGFTRLNSFGLRNFASTYDNLRQMPYQAVNLSLTKNFEVTERARLQLRAEALNAFNHPYVIDYNLDPSNARFGFSAGVQRNLPRDIQLGAKFTF